MTAQDAEPAGDEINCGGTADGAADASGPDRATLKQRLRPGSWSALGFLGTGESLDEVRAQDAETMSCLGLSHEALADGLEQVMSSALELFRTPVPPERIDEVLTHQTFFPNFYAPESIPHFDLEHLPDPKSGFMIGNLQVFLVNNKEWQSCPWGCHAYSSNDFMLVNRQTGDTVTAPELMPHLIRTHHFFCGRESPYRTDPEQLAKVLGMIDT